MDSSQQAIRVTLFNGAVDSYHDVVTPGATCYFFGGRIKRAFASNGGDSEVSFGAGSEIRQITETIACTPVILSVRINDLASSTAGSTINAFAIIHAVGALKINRKARAAAS